MCDFSEIEASAFSDTMTWDPMNSDSAVQEIESRMKDLKTEEKKESPPKEAEGPPEETAENEAPKEEEEPDFGDAEKIVPTETEENNDPPKDSSHGDAIIPLKPRVNILQPTQDGQASDSEQARPDKVPGLSPRQPEPSPCLGLGHTQGRGLEQGMFHHLEAALPRGQRKDRDSCCRPENLDRRKIGPLSPR